MRQALTAIAHRAIGFWCARKACSCAHFSGALPISSSTKPSNESIQNVTVRESVRHTFSADIVKEAALIGHRIVGRALHDGDTCTWEVVTPDLTSAASVALSVRATDNLYQGASGIALFLTELWEATGDATLLDCARRAMRYCDRIVVPGSERVGLHSGSMGVALAAARMAELTAEDEWQDLAVRRIQRMGALVQRDFVRDIIGGSAGAILALLRIERMLDLPWLLEIAVQFGEHLEQTARRRPNGWSWDPGNGMARQDLTGYALGASGMAHAFLELYASTADRRWQFAAIRSMEYERYCEIEKSGDWPDFRELEMSGQISRGELQSLRQQLRTGASTISRKPTHIVRAWCHGAPGISLSRIRALSLDVDSIAVRPELERALRSTRESISRGIGAQSHCLCHGVFGNAESLLMAREQLGIDDNGLVQATLDWVCASYGGSKRPWITGVVGGGYDPSLMVGEAGIGHFLLRVARPEVGSVLCLSNWKRLASNNVSPDDEYRADELRQLLPVAVRAVEVAGDASTVREHITTLISSNANVGNLVAKVRSSIVTDNSAAGDLLRDARSVDGAVLDEQCAFTDYIEQFCYEITRPEQHEINWDIARVRFAPHARLIGANRAWSLRQGDAVLPPEEEEFVVVYRTAQSVRRKTLTELHSIILSEIAEPTTLEEIVNTVVSSIDAQPSVASELPAYIRGIVQDAVVLGFAEVVQSGAGSS